MSRSKPRPRRAVAARKDDAAAALARANAALSLRIEQLIIEITQKRAQIEARRRGAAGRAASGADAAAGDV